MEDLLDLCQPTMSEFSIRITNAERIREIRDQSLDNEDGENLSGEDDENTKIAQLVQELQNYNES